MTTSTVLRVVLLRSRLCLLAGTLVVAVLSGRSAQAASEPQTATNRFVLASWNVENLFDPYEDPANPGSKDFTPNGWTRWTPERYAQKLEHLAEIIAAMRPDVLCLVEIENRRVLTDLVRVLHEKQQVEMPVILHREGGDRRGIDVAMLARFAPVATNWLAPVPEQRDLLFARFVVNGRPLTVCLNHWKSWLGDAAENVRIRTAEAQAERNAIERRLKEDPTAALVATGDFNDNVDSEILTHVAGFVLYRPAADGSLSATGLLYNLSGLLPADRRGTFYYGKDRVWNSFDSISVCRGMLPGSSKPSIWQVMTNSYEVFAQPQQRDADGHPLPFHRVRKKDPDGVVRSAYVTGYSDHFPVRVVLEPGALER